jgi:hypothetical protein
MKTVQNMVGWFGLFPLLPIGAQGIREKLRFTSFS